MKEYALNTFDSMNTVIIDECFPANTYILTENGNYSISKLYEMWQNNEEIPLIRSYNEILKQFEYKKLTYAWKKPHNGEMVKIKIDNNVIKCTPNHKILTSDGYKEASLLNIGDAIVSSCNGFFENSFSKINEIGKIYKTCEVFDIEVEDNHNFIIGHKLPENMIDNSGIVVHNCHHIGSKVFSKALRKVNSQYMIGLSATPNRKDGLTKVFKWYVGDVVYSKKHMDTNIVKVERLIIKSDNEEYSKEHTNYRGNAMMPKMINNIVENLHRTRLIVYWIKELLNEDRKIIVLSDRRAHLEDFYKLLTEVGVKSVGYYVGGMKQADLDISATKSVILGTFHISAEGLDIPGLDTEILATPKSDIVQSVGRILRKTHADKPAKIIDIVDKFSLFENQASKRYKLYSTRKYQVEDITVWDKLDANGEPVIIKKVSKNTDKKSTKTNDAESFLQQFNHNSMFSDDSHPILDTKEYCTQDNPISIVKTKAKASAKAKTSAKTNNSTLPKIDNQQSMFSDDSHPILDTKAYNTQDKPNTKPKAKAKSEPKAKVEPKAKIGGDSQYSVLPKIDNKDFDKYKSMFS